MKTGTAELLKQLETVSNSVDDAIKSLEAAQQDAQDGLERFQGLGGSAGRAQQVADLLEDLMGQVHGLSADIAASMVAVREVDEAKTPEENVEKLAVVVELAGTSGDAVTERINACDDTRTEVLGHFEGSQLGEDIAARIDTARDVLEEAHPALQTVSETAAAQQEDYRKGTEGSSPGSAPSSSTGQPAGNPAPSSSSPSSSS